MRCTSKKRKYRRKQKQNKFKAAFGTILVIGILIAGYFGYRNRFQVLAYETKQYHGAVYEEPLRIDKLCVAGSDVVSKTFQTTDQFHSSALFQLDEAEVLYADHIHEKVYPASTTKILTAYMAFKYGNLEEVVTVSENAVLVPLDSSRAGLRAGDQLTLEALLYGLMLPSGNDSAVAIAEHISGDVDTFVRQMNEEAKKLGATNSNFVNPHGYHDADHYTTAYDLYLIFQECIRYDKFVEIISSPVYKTNITQKNGTYREVSWNQSNQYVNGMRKVPEYVNVIGGKTGTTDEAGACLILYVKEHGHPYISVIMGADLKNILYDNMTKLILSASVSK